MLLRMLGGGSKIGEGARDVLAEWRFSVRSGARKGLVDGVNANSDGRVPESGGPDVCIE